LPNSGLLGIYIIEESGRLKMIIEGQEWADNGRSIFLVLGIIGIKRWLMSRWYMKEFAIILKLIMKLSFLDS
jgi:hypothetical protein